MEAKSIELPCIVERVTYRKDKFAILSCNLDPYSYRYNKDLQALVDPYISDQWNSFTVIVDTLAEDEKPEGTSYVIVGKFVHDPKRGKQFKATGYYQDVPTSEKGMKKFLMTLPNIKESRAKQILSIFPLDRILEILDSDPNELLQIRGITQKRLEVIVLAWNKSKHKRELYEWFMECHIPLKLADKAFDKWKAKTRKTIEENPYLLTELRGIDFHRADIIAHRISNKVNPQFRVSACIDFCLKEDSQSNGNLCMPYSTMKATVVNVLARCDSSMGLTSEINYAKTIPHIIKEPLSGFTAVKDKTTNMSFIYLSSVWEKEAFIAEVLFSRDDRPSALTCDDADIEKAEKGISFFLGKEITLDKTQIEAIKSAFNNRVTVITGGGGTGKSTICRCIYSLAREQQKTVNMMSPTGKAAKVLSYRTGGAATTIHRGLKMGPGSVLPNENITQDILLIDEISMSGIDTMYALMVAVHDNPYANIVFVGDKNQLPSVSPGNFLSDLISADCVNVVTLDKIHRQDENSFISLIANDISKGVVTPIPETANDISWQDIRQDTFQEEIRVFVDEYLAKGEVMDNLQFLSPMKKGCYGVHLLNDILQTKMSSINGTENQFIDREFKKFHVGDRIIQIKNNYDKSVFNGDMGTITELGEKIKDPTASDVKEKFIIADFSGELKIYYGIELDQLLLAWAITVHKFQGSQSKHIVMILASEAQVMMNKELVYTGFTRAEKHLYVYGHDHMYRLAPSRSAIKKRFTNLNNLMKEMKTGEKILQVV